MKKKIIIIAVIIALVAAAVAFFEFSGVKETIKDKIEEKKMWEARSEDLVAHINKDKFFTNRYGEISSYKIIEKKITPNENGGEIVTLTISCETKSHFLQIYASKNADANWRYDEESIRIK